MRRALPLVLPILATLLPLAALAQNKPAPLDTPGTSQPGASGAERVPDLPGKPAALPPSRANRPPPARVQDAPRTNRPSRQTPPRNATPTPPTGGPGAAPSGSVPTNKPAPAPGPGEREA